MSSTRTHANPTERRSVLLAGLIGLSVLGFLLGSLTLKLNPRLAADASDAVLLLFYFTLGYGLIGLALGILGVGVTTIARRCLPATAGRWLAQALVSWWLLGPLVYFALLPDVRWSGNLLTDLIFNHTRAVQLVFGLGLALAVAGLGLLLGRLVKVAGVGRVDQLSSGRWWVALLLAWLVLSGFQAFYWQGADREAVPPLPDPAALRPAFAPDPLILLCIDGADFQIIDPMVQDHELPTFARLLREGTHGPLATQRPARSPNVWTSIVTGKKPEDHGIRHFVNFRFPGIDHPVERFPSATGLNFHVIPRLEKLPGFPSIQAPYTSDMRRAPALWEIIGGPFQVGVYRWLVTWPAQPVKGFNVAASVVADAMQLVDGRLQENGKLLRQGVYYPEELILEVQHQLASWTPPKPDLAPYIGDQQQVAPSQTKLAKIQSSLYDPTVHLLPHLMAKYQPRFVVAGFYPVDGFQHLFSQYRGTDLPFANAVAERYRYSDARLGEFLAALTPPFNLIVVSDHGFDFVHHHHSEDPPGIFIAWGPAFTAGRQVSGLSIYDLAPLSLHLMGLPLADDMVGTATGHYQQALAPDFLAQHAVSRVPSYEFIRQEQTSSAKNSEEELIKQELRSLGYIQ